MLTILCGSVGLSHPPLVVAFDLFGAEKRTATAEQSVINHLSRRG